MSLMAIMVMALAAGFTSCNEKVESQIFDLSYDAGDLGNGTAMSYEQNYKPIIIAALSKVAKPVTEGGTTFMLNTTQGAAQKVMKEAFENGTSAAQKAAGEPSIFQGLKVILKYSTTSNQTPVDFLEYTFK